MRNNDMGEQVENLDDIPDRLKKTGVKVSATEPEEILRRQRALDEYLEEAGPVLAELSAAGFDLNPSRGISDLIKNKSYRNKSSYKRAIQILLHWLPRVEDLRVKEDIVRTLTIKWAKPAAAPTLIEEFLATGRSGSYKWAVGNALSVVADDIVFDEVVEVVQDKGHGSARQMVVVALGNMSNPNAVQVLLELLEDDEMAGHALMALGKLGAMEAYSHIEQFLKHPKSWIRKEAKKALERITRAQ